MRGGAVDQYLFGDAEDPARDIMTFRATDEFGMPHMITMDGRDVRNIAMFFEARVRAEPHEDTTGCEPVRIVYEPQVKILTVGSGGERGWFPMTIEVFEQFRADLREIGQHLAPWTLETSFAGSDPRRMIWRERAGTPLQGPREVRRDADDRTGC